MKPTSTNVSIHISHVIKHNVKLIIRVKQVYETTNCGLHTRHERLWVEGTSRLQLRLLAMIEVRRLEVDNLNQYIAVYGVTIHRFLNNLELEDLRITDSAVRIHDIDED